MVLRLPENSFDNGVLGEDEDLQLPTSRSRQIALAQQDTLEKIGSYTLGESIGYGIPGSILAMADTFAESMSFGLVGENDFENFAKEHLGEFGEFFSDNRETLGLVGDIGGAFIPGMLAVKGIRATGFLGSALQRSLGKNASRYFVSTGKSNQELFARAYARARTLRKKGVSNFNLYPEVGKMRAKAYGRSFADVLVESAAAESAIALTMNESEFLFPDEMTVADNIAWFAGTSLLAGGFGHLMARSEFKRGLNKVLKDVPRQNQDLAEVIGNIANNRGPAIAMHSMALQEISKRLSAARASGDDVLRNQAGRDATSVEFRLRELTESAFQDSPLEGITTSVRLNRSKQLDDPRIETMQAAYAHDPKFGVNLQSLETFSDDYVSQFDRRVQTRIEKKKLEFAEKRKQMAQLEKKSKLSSGQAKKYDRLRNQTATLQAELKQLNETVGVVVELDGTTTGITGRSRIFQDGDRQLTKLREKSTSARVGNRDLMAEADGNIYITDDINKIDLDSIDEAIESGGAINRITDDKWQSLTHLERTAIYDVQQDVIERLGVGPNRNQINPDWDGMSLNDESHFTQIDFAIDIIERYGEQAARKIRGFTSLEDLRFESMRRKFTAYQKMRKQVEKELKKGETPAYHNMQNVAKALNLPNDSNTIQEFFEQSRVADDIIDLKDMASGYQDLMDGIRKHLGLQSSDDMSNFPLTGNMLNLGRSRKPVVGVMRNLENRAAVQREDLLHQMAADRKFMADTLKESDDTIIVKSIMDSLKVNANAVQSFKRELPSLVHGLQQEGAITKRVLQQPFVYREEFAFKQADAVAREFTKRSEKAIQNYLERTIPRHQGQLPESQRKTHQQIFNRIVEKGAEVDLDMAMIARTALNAGWDVAKQPFVRATGRNGETVYNIALDGKSAKNRELWERMFPGEQMPSSEQVLLPITGGRKPVTLTQRGLDVIQSLDEISQQLRREENALRRARGLKPIKQKRLHVPPVDLSHKHRMYLIDKAGKLQRVIGDETEANLKRRVDKEVKASNGELMPVTEADMRRYHDARAQAFFEMVDYSGPAHQTGTATGRSATAVTQTGTAAFKQMIDTTLRHYQNVQRRTLQTVFDPEIQYLRLQKMASGVSDTDRTVYDDLISTLTGTSNFDPNSTIGKAYTTAEHLYDTAVQAVYDNMIKALPTTTLAERRARKRVSEMEQRFVESHRPFENFTEYLEKTAKVELPQTLRRHGPLLNEITTYMTIGILDAGMAVINLASLAATLPPVVAMLRRMPDETEQMWRDRIGAFSAVTPENNAYFSPAKAAVDGMHFMYSQEGRRVAKIARDNGYFDQFAAEQVELWGRTGEEFVSGLLRRGAKKLSFLTLWSEEKARAISWMTMYNVGKKGLKLSDEGAMAFAHQQANNVIADFRPTSRPTIFQGAAGVPLGLFTTFMWNYTQRLLSLVERRNVHAGAIQAAVQGGLFGAESLPGWDLYTETFMSNYDGSHSPVDRLNESLGYVGADVFLNGTVSNIPRMFGAETGISIGPRAAVGLPFERGVGAQAVPGLQLLTRAAGTAGKLIDQSIQGLEPHQAAETLAGANMNKFMSNWLEVAMGHSLDYNENIIEEDTRSRMSIVSRLLGFKPMLADELRQENVRNRTTDRIRNELKERLSSKLKAHIRNNTLTSRVVDEALGDYVKAGGNPESFRRYFQSQVLRGTTSKLDLEITDALRGNIDENRLGRLLYISRD